MPNARLETIAYADLDPLDYTFRATLLEDSTNARYRAATYYRDLRDQASDAVAATVEHLDDLDETITVTRLALGEAEDAQRTAAVVLAEAEAAERAARQAAELVSLGVGGSPADGSFVRLGEWPSGRRCASASRVATTGPSAPPGSTGAPTSSISAPGPAWVAPVIPSTPRPPSRTTGPRSSGPSGERAPGRSAGATSADRRGPPPWRRRGPGCRGKVPRRWRTRPRPQP